MGSVLRVQDPKDLDWALLEVLVSGIGAGVYPEALPA